MFESMNKLTAFVLLCYVVLVQCTNQPIIGILAQETSSLPEIRVQSANGSYIAASYVKAVEASGARVVPIFIQKNYSYYRNLMQSINGVVVPGGLASLGPGNGYYDALTHIYKIAKKMNNRGIFFPIFAVCLGLQAVLTISNNHRDILTKCDVLHENLPLIFKPNYNHSFQYSMLSEEITIYLKYFDSTKNYHNWCITPLNFSNTSLPSEWFVTATSYNKQGLEFISSVEHKNYPFLAVLFHAEKQYEWKPNQNNIHSKISIKLSRYFYDVIVELAKLNNNKFIKESKEYKSLIYNYAPISKYTWKFFDQVYIFE